MTRLMKFFALALAACLLAGCLNTANTVGNADSHMQPVAIRQSRFTTDSALERRLEIRRLDGSVNSSGLLEVQLEALNTRTGFWSGLWSSLRNDVPYQVDYKIVWLNSQGMEVNSLMSTWRRVEVIPGETLYIHAVAPNQDCKDFRISMKAVK